MVDLEIQKAAQSGLSSSLGTVLKQISHESLVREVGVWAVWHFTNLKGITDLQGDGQVNYSLRLYFLICKIIIFIR